MYMCMYECLCVCVYVGCETKRFPLRKVEELLRSTALVGPSVIRRWPEGGVPLFHRKKDTLAKIF